MDTALAGQGTLVLSMVAVIGTLSSVIAALYWNADRRSQELLRRMEDREDKSLSDIATGQTEIVTTLKNLVHLVEEVAETNRENRIQTEVDRRVRALQEKGVAP